MVILEPNHSQEIIYIHMLKVQLRNITHSMLREVRNKVLKLLAEDAAINNLDNLLKTAEIQNRIDEVDLVIQKPLQIILIDN